MEIGIVSLPTINITKTSLYLPSPTRYNTGGYKINIDNKIIYEYSPIDLTIAGLTSIYLHQTNITNLSRWFLCNPNRIAESWVTCTISIKTNLITFTISGWKIISRDNPLINSLFIKNSPFTFRE
jgi:hypothetical protein